MAGGMRLQNVAPGWLIPNARRAVFLSNALHSVHGPTCWLTGGFSHNHKFWLSSCRATLSMFSRQISKRANSLALFSL